MTKNAIGLFLTALLIVMGGCVSSPDSRPISNTYPVNTIKFLDPAYLPNVKAVAWRSLAEGPCCSLDVPNEVFDGIRTGLQKHLVARLPDVAFTEALKDSSLGGWRLNLDLYLAAEALTVTNTLPCFYSIIVSREAPPGVLEVLYWSEGRVFETGTNVILEIERELDRLADHWKPGSGGRP